MECIMFIFGILVGYLFPKLFRDLKSSYHYSAAANERDIYLPSIYAPSIKVYTPVDSLDRSNPPIDDIIPSEIKPIPPWSH